MQTPKSILTAEVQVSLNGGGVYIGGDFLTLGRDDRLFGIQHFAQLSDDHTMGIALSCATVINSYPSMKHKVLNLAHLMKNYDRENIARDRIIGTVIGVECMPGRCARPGAEPPVSLNGASMPRAHIRAVAAIHKLAERRGQDYRPAPELDGIAGQ
jgi:hypothetical protein